MIDIPHFLKKLVLLVLGAGIFLASFGCTGADNEKTASKKELIRLDMLTTVLGKPIDSPVFSLKDHKNRDFNAQNFKGQWTFLFFGYTRCPDICPATMNKLNDVYQDLAQQGDLNNTSFIMISVDPVRDTLKGLAEYVKYFNDKFIGVTGDEEQIGILAKKFAIMYTKEETKKEDYLVGHSTSILLIDPKGRQFARFSAPHNPATIVSDFRKIRKKYE